MNNPKYALFFDNHTTTACPDVGSELKIDGAEVEGKSRKSESPTFFLHHYGKGEALLMNCVFPELDVSVLKRMDDLFNVLGVKPSFTVKNKENVAEKVKSPRLEDVTFYTSVPYEIEKPKHRY